MKDATNEADRNGAGEPTAFEPPAIVDYGDVAKETRDGAAGTFDGANYS